MIFSWIVMSKQKNLQSLTARSLDTLASMRADGGWFDFGYMESG